MNWVMEVFINSEQFDRLVSLYIKCIVTTSQLKYVSWLEENVSRAIDQNSMTP